MKKRPNKHGMMWKKEGNFLYISKPGTALNMAYVKWLDPDMFTEEMIDEDLTRPFAFTQETEVVTFPKLMPKGKDRSYTFPVDVYGCDRVNKHGVEFTMMGVRFVHEDILYEVGLPPQCDLSHAYTPELLVWMVENHGVYSHHSQMWVKPGVKNKAVKTVWE